MKPAHRSENDSHGMYRSELLEDLIGRLQLVQKDDQMGKDDADTLLAGAVTLNYKFIEAATDETGAALTQQQIKEIVIERINGILEKMA